MRQATRDFQVPDTNVIIPKGSSITIPSYAIQTDAEYYPEPFKFDPDRFTEENEAKRHPMTYLPFGDGPR